MLDQKGKNRATTVKKNMKMDATLSLRNIMKPILLLVVFLILITSKSISQPLAFPGAEGFGKFTTGGRGGKVLIVDNLNDSGPGSLREAVNQKYPRIIVFSVSGTIPLEAELKINSGNVTIAGQSAPGDGICLKNFPLIVSADNVVIRYLRVRMGDETAQQDDCISVVRRKNIIIDHCSFSWATDEVASCYDNENFTLQWCIISESFNKSVHEKGEHGYGGIWGGKGASFHHNLLAHHKSRLPRFCGARYHKEPEKEIVDFRNNVIYNWKSNSAYAGEEGQHNIVNNYYKSGPATESSKKTRILNPWAPYGKFYVSGNVLAGNKEISGNNRLGIVADHPDSCLIFQPIDVVEILTQRADEAYKVVLSNAGASISRDRVDARVVEEVSSGTAHYGPKRDGIINSQVEVGGWPKLDLASQVKDTDKDGMPDDWEKKKGLNPSDESDNTKNTLDGDYTNIEVYLNGLVN
jgi:pectate lyase